ALGCPAATPATPNEAKIAIFGADAVAAASAPRLFVFGRSGCPAATPATPNEAKIAIFGADAVGAASAPRLFVFGRSGCPGRDSRDAGRRQDRHLQRRRGRSGLRAATLRLR